MPTSQAPPHGPTLLRYIIADRGTDVLSCHSDGVAAAQRKSSAAASAPPTTFKIPPISRAQRSAGTACSALRHPSFERHPHAPTTLSGDHALHDRPSSV